MLEVNHKLDHKIQNHPLENPEIIKEKIHLMAWNQYENLARE